jgi:hypothetical protein
LANAQPQSVIRLHPNLPALYRRKVANLAVALNEPGIASEAAEIMRGLIERIVLTSVGQILKAELFGDLHRLMMFAQVDEDDKQRPGSVGEPARLWWLREHATALICCCRRSCRPCQAPPSEVLHELASPKQT